MSNQTPVQQQQTPAQQSPKIPLGRTVTADGGNMGRIYCR